MEVVLHLWPRLEQTHPMPGYCYLMADFLCPELPFSVRSVSTLQFNPSVLRKIVTTGDAKGFNMFDQSKK